MMPQMKLRHCVAIDAGRFSTEMICQFIFLPFGREIEDDAGEEDIISGMCLLLILLV